MSSSLNSSAGPPTHESAIVSKTSNFVLQKYIRQHEIDSCTTASMNAAECACLLSGSKNTQVCTSGFNAVQSQVENPSVPFEPLKWCMANQPAENSESWLIGCINGIRK